MAFNEKILTKSDGTRNVDEPRPRAEDGAHKAQVASDHAIHNQSYHVDNTNVEHDAVTVAVVHVLPDRHQAGHVQQLKWLYLAFIWIGTDLVKRGQCHEANAQQFALALFQRDRVDFIGAAIVQQLVFPRTKKEKLHCAGCPVMKQIGKQS